MNEGFIKYDNAQKQSRYDKAYLLMAIEWAKLSHCQRKQVGALLVKEGMIISDGYNGTPSGFPNECEDCNDHDGGGNPKTHWYVLHAEANAIMKVAKSNNSARNSTLYLTLSPCKDCSKLVLQSGIKRLVFIHEYKDRTGLDFLIEAGVDVSQISIEELGIGQNR
jgi:dCMP deaminase